VVLSVRASPRASRTSIARGPGGECFAVRLTAPPVDGAANSALVAFIAKTFGVAKRDVTILSGETGRTKRVAIAGDPAALAEIAQRLYGDEP
jgi:uncharacterized protein (TIGR00251 family)